MVVAEAPVSAEIRLGAAARLVARLARLAVPAARLEVGLAVHSVRARLVRVPGLAGSPAVSVLVEWLALRVRRRLPAHRVPVDAGHAA